jgi:NhaP-type Na+/H+ or K+/H+ antiporter
MKIILGITPTDPVLAHSVIKGKFANRYIPMHLRDFLSAESGANDGLGFPFLMLPVYMLMFPNNLGEVFESWFVITWIYEIALSIFVGIVSGYTARRLLQWSEKKNMVDKESFLVFSIALAIFIAGLVSLIASDDLLAIFIAGNAFTWDEWFTEKTKEAHLQEVIDMLFNVSFFVFFGALIPWNSFISIGLGKLVGLALSILVFRRLPIVFLLRRFTPVLRSKKEAFFAGWFGPMGGKNG